MAEVKKIIPKRRFKEFQNGEAWEERKLSESYKFSQGLQVPVEEQFNNCLDGYERFIRIVDVTQSDEPQRYIQNITRKGRVKNEDIFFVRYGAVGAVGYGYSGTIANNLFVLTPLIKVNSKFMFQQFSATKFNTKLTEMSASTSMPAINFGALNNMKFWYPPFEEQEKIGWYFEQLDNLITLHQRKLDKIKSMKKAYLSEMFPAEGERKPKRRFKGFTDDWELCKVQNFVDNGILAAPMDGNHGEKHPTTRDYVASGIPFIMARDFDGGYVDLKHCSFISAERAERLDKGFAQNNDVLLTHKATIGETAIIKGLKEKYAVLTPQVTYYRILNLKKLTTDYLYAYFNTERFQNELKTEAIQSTRAYIGITDQRKLSVIFPVNIDEQKKIGSYFFYLDNLITLHQHKLDKLKNLKKAYLNEMFI
ncbi:MAG: hypothetical protein B6I17_04220 [Tenericutes bacterium 4572_104]|nr:MAG: hypothetical protein B6I17_04220 [Tenericutes bacterium 4572_104]